MEKILYVIGNGFDRHHGMQTSYHDFANYIKENTVELHDLLNNYISYPSSDNDCWYCFEENLANLDVDQILSDNTYYLPDIASDEFRDRDLHAFPDVMENTLSSLTTDLFEIFRKFILDVEMPKSAFERRLELKKDALFFTFNYTATLEELYKIETSRILHIHNRAIDDYDDIILGHGIDPKSFEKEEESMPEGLSLEEEQEWHERRNDSWDYSYDTGENRCISILHFPISRLKRLLSQTVYFSENLVKLKKSMF